MIESGTVLQSRFLIEDRIGEGGMGAVYLATDEKFGTRVAIKETFYGDAELAEAFEREARLLNGLHHPIFPHVSDHFVEGGGHFLVMEYIEGEDVSVLLKRGENFSFEEVMRWTLDLLDGLDYLHSQDPPVIHRDIKPNNLKLTSRGNIMLLDFGMAKETEGNTLGMKSVFGYSRRYSPLEQIEGTGTDTRSDIFSLGATIFHLLTGDPPVDVLARASAIVAGKPDPLRLASEIRPDIPESVATILHSALTLNPDQRFVSARAMWNALEYALGLDTAAHIVPAAAAPVPADTSEAESAIAGAAQSDRSDVSNDRPLDRAVIHLGTVDSADELFDADTEEDGPLENKDEQLPVTAGVLGPQSRLFGGPSRPIVWGPILLFCTALAFFGLFAGDDGSHVQGSNVVSAHEALPSNAAADSTEKGKDVVTEGPSETEVAATSPEAAAVEIVQEVADEPIPPADDEANASDIDPESSREGTPGSDQIQNESDIPDAEPEIDFEDSRSERGNLPARSGRTTRPRVRRQRAEAERPRIVPAWEDDPSMVTIETILTGSPYEDRRNGTRWMTREEEKEFRRRLKRMRKHFRDNDN